MNEKTYEIEVKWEIVTRISIPVELVSADPDDYDAVDKQVLGLICGRDLLQPIDDHTVTFDTDYLSDKGITLEMEVYGDPSPMQTWEVPDWQITVFDPERLEENTGDIDDVDDVDFF